MILHWWFWPILAVISGVVLAIMASKEGGGDWDFFTPLITFICVIGGIVVALAFIAGHYL